MNKDDSNPIYAIPLAELGAIASHVLDTEAIAVGTLSIAQIGRSNGQTTNDAMERK